MRAVNAMTASFVWLHNLNLNLPALGSKVIAGPSLLYSELASLIFQAPPFAPYTLGQNGKLYGSEQDPFPQRRLTIL